MGAVVHGRLALRTARNLSALKLSKALGISNSSLRNYETGRTPVPKGLAEKIVALFPDVPDLGESPDPTREAFCADDLRKLRLSRNLSRRALAKALGMDAPTIKEYESGQKKIPPGKSERENEWSRKKGFNFFYYLPLPYEITYMAISLRPHSLHISYVSI